MKKIEAIIRKTKFDEVKEALTEAGIDFFSFWEMRGVGQARQERAYRGVVYDTSTIERIMISIIVRDKNVDKTAKAIMEAGRTGPAGPGKLAMGKFLLSPSNKPTGYVPEKPETTHYT